MRVMAVALTAKSADIINHKVLYGSVYKKDFYRIGECVESMIEICLLILAIEMLYLYMQRKNTNNPNIN